MAHLSPAQRVAAGLRLPAGLAHPFAATQAAWRFYANDRMGLPELAGPLIDCVQVDIPQTCENWLLVAMDWCNLHYTHHESKRDRVELAHPKDLGYQLLTALAVADRDGVPLAPLCLELRAADGVYSTRANRPLKPTSSLDDLEPVMAHLQAMELGKTPVFIIDREADSVGHYRPWNRAGYRFLVRANDNPQVVYNGRKRRLSQMADGVKRRQELIPVRTVFFKGQPATQWVGETGVVLTRPARLHRVDRKTGKLKHHNISGEPLALRLIVSEVRDEQGRVLARWLLLTNLPAEVGAAIVALWYYWRWRIESYHKLLKGAGQQIECWQQETAEALARRLLVAAMASVVVWRLARDESPQAAEMRDLLVGLSGRQMKRGRNARGFTEPALLAGLGVLVSMLECLRHYDPSELRRLAEATLSGLVHPLLPKSSQGDDG